MDLCVVAIAFRKIRISHYQARPRQKTNFEGGPRQNGNNKKQTITNQEKWIVV